MTTQEVANRYNELAQQGQWDQIYQELWADEISQTEPDWSGQPVTRGKDNCLARMEEWNKGIEEFHGGFSDEPVVAGNWFSVRMGLDVTRKDMGRMKMEELVLCHVQNGKIDREQFFYDNPMVPAN